MEPTTPEPYAVVEEYGLHSGDKWVRVDIGVLELSAAGIGEANRKLTRTMLSVRAARPDELPAMSAETITEGGVTLIRAADVADKLEQLAANEDRSITWPTYPDPATRFAAQFYKREMTARATLFKPRSDPA
jgi:hypothetical protein